MFKQIDMFKKWLQTLCQVRYVSLAMEPLGTRTLITLFETILTSLPHLVTK